MTATKPAIITLQDGRVVAIYSADRWVAMGSCWWIGAYRWCAGGEITPPAVSRLRRPPPGATPAGQRRRRRMTATKPAIITLQDGRVVAIYSADRWVAMGSCWWIGAYRWCAGGEISIAGGWDEQDEGTVHGCDDESSD